MKDATSEQKAQLNVIFGQIVSHYSLEVLQQMTRILV
jgi:hypothetical protein